MQLRSAGALLVILASLALGACDSPQEREAEHIKNGKTLYEAGQYAKAAIELRNALQINPTSTETKYLLGQVLEHQGNLAAAFSAFQEVSFQDPKHRDAQLKLGQYALMNADAAAATLHADNAIALDPQRADGHTMKAAALLLQRKFPDVDAEIQAALSLKPHDEDALIVQASERLLQGRAADAEAVIADGLSASPKSKQLLTFRVKLLRDQGRTQEAETTLRQLIAIEPDNPDFILALAKDLHDGNQLDAAIKLFRESIAHSSDPLRLLGAYANFLETTAGVPRAIDEVSAFSGTFGDKSKYKFLLARLHVKAKEFDKAIEILTPLVNSLQREDEKLDVRVELARIELLKGNRDTAIKQLDAIVQEDKSQYNALLLRATIALEDGRYDATIADARSALNEDPQSSGALAVLSQVYLRTGEQNLAVDVLRNLTKVAPNNLDAHLQLAGLLLPNSADEALQHIDAAIKLAPDNSELRLKKAQTLIYSKRWDQAEVIGHDLLNNPPTAGIGHQILGEAAFVRKDYKTAIAELKSALDAGRHFDDIGPKLTQALELSKGAASAGGEAQDGGSAEQLLNDRIAANPKDAMALMLLADLRLHAGDPAAAEQALRRAVEADPSNNMAYLNLSRVLKQGGKIDEMAAVLARAAKQFPDDRLMQESEAIGREIAADYTGARTAYQQVLAKWPNSLVAANNLAQLVADVWPDDRDQLNAARQLLEKYRDKDNPAILDTLGWVQTRLGNGEDAIILLERATSLAPNNSDALYHYAVALSQKGLAEKAKTTVQRALASGVKFRGIEDAQALAEKLR